MSTLRPTKAPLVYPLTLACVGAVAALITGDFHIEAIVVAALLVVAGAIVGRLLLAQQTALFDAMHALITEQQRFGVEVAPVWGRHIESSKEQMETAIADISMRFSGIVDKLGVAIQTASMETDNLQGSDKTLIAVISRAEHELGLIVEAQHDATASMLHMLEKVEGLDRFTKELQDMAHDVAKIAQQSTLLSLNAAIEAARAGELGRGFAVVAKEFRMLSNQSGETGRHIAEKVKVISAAISESSSAVRESAKQREERSHATESTITGVIDDFKEVTGMLERSSEVLKEESKAIQSEIGHAIVDFQFQDRVGQILYHLKNNIDQWPQFLQSHQDQCAQTGEVPMLDPQVLLDELKKTYVMADQHVIHSGGKVTAPKQDDEITFF
jgi:methyl-accepting chemotaxis protein